MTVSEARAPVSSTLVVQRLGTHPLLPTRGPVSSQQKPPHPWHSPARPQPQGPALAQSESPQMGMTSQEVSGAISDRGPPPAVCTDTQGRGGGRAAEPAAPKGGRAAVECSPAVPRGPPGQIGPVPPALRRELEPSCTWRSGGKADVEASASHQQAPVCSPDTRRHGRSVLAEYTGNLTSRCSGVLRNMFNVVVVGNLEI